MPRRSFMTPATQLDRDRAQLAERAFHTDPSLAAESALLFAQSRLGTVTGTARF